MKTHRISFYASESRTLTHIFGYCEEVICVGEEIKSFPKVRKCAISLSPPLLHLLYSEDKTLESAVVKVISPVEQSDAGLEIPESSSSLVVREILQEAPELITEQLAHLLRGER